MKEIHDIRKYLEIHREIRKEINSKMSFIPFATISLTFIMTCFHIAHYVSIGGKDQQDIFETWLEYIVIIIANLLMILILSSLPDDNETYLAIITMINQHDLHPASLEAQVKNNSLINYISSLQQNNIQHKAWNMFVINKSFLLSFFGSLITFCVMLIQLYESSLANDSKSQNKTNIA